MNNKQILNDYTLENEALQIRLDFTPMEQLKIAKNILDLLHGDIFMNEENDTDTKTLNTLTTISLQLKEIIKEYEEEV